MYFFCTVMLNFCFANEPNNGSFELFDNNENTHLNDPNFWQTENYANVLSTFIPDPFPGAKSEWAIDIYSPFEPFDGNSFILLSSIDGGEVYSLASQKLTIGQGDKLQGVYFFGACDYRPFSDYAIIKLVSTDEIEPLPDVNIAYFDIDMLGNYGSFGGWKRFEHTFTAQEAGEYNLVLKVSDVGDSALNSYLAVDGLLLSRYNAKNPPPEKGDFNCDGTVDLEDFRIMAGDWGYDCNNPIYYNSNSGQRIYDPNCNCLLGTDIDGSGPVDFNDMGIFFDNWLMGNRRE
ncbi:MAG: hypothetical protein ABFD79_06795 [Phycisphaerales bacterium]